MGEYKMKIAILGAGNGGCTVAADLSIKGHEVTLIKTSLSMHNENFQFLLDNNGQIKLQENDKVTLANIYRVTNDLAELSKADLIIVYIQTNYHEELIKRFSKYLQDDQ